MSAVIQQGTGVLYLERTPEGRVSLTIRDWRGGERSLELNQQELHKLYCELGVLLVERPTQRAANG